MLDPQFELGPLLLQKVVFLIQDTVTCFGVLHYCGMQVFFGRKHADKKENNNEEKHGQTSRAKTWQAHPGQH